MLIFRGEVALRVLARVVSVRPGAAIRAPFPQTSGEFLAFVLRWNEESILLRGRVVAFGGRVLPGTDGPKYKNSQDSVIYSKSRTLYSLNLSKAGIREAGFAVLVEGYFDFAQVYQAGFRSVVASCGTALTPAQAQQLRRFTGRVVLSFDPDAAGQGATAKSCEMLVAEGFEVNVAILPAG